MDMAPLVIANWQRPGSRQNNQGKWAMQPSKQYWSSTGRGGGQKSRDSVCLEPRRSNAQIFFLRTQLLRSIKRNQINQTLVFKGAVRLLVDKLADLFSGGGGGSKAWRTERGDRRRRFGRKTVKLNTKSPPGGRVKTLDRFVRDRPASDTNFFAQLAKLFFRPFLKVSGLKKLSRNSGWGG